MRHPYQLEETGPVSVSHVSDWVLAIWPARRVTPLLPPRPTIRIPGDSCIGVVVVGGSSRVVWLCRRKSRHQHIRPTSSFVIGITGAPLDTPRLPSAGCRHIRRNHPKMPPKQLVCASQFY